MSWKYFSNFVYFSHKVNFLVWKIISKEEKISLISNWFLWNLKALVNRCIIKSIFITNMLIFAVQFDSSLHSFRFIDKKMIEISNYFNLTSFKELFLPWAGQKFALLLQFANYYYIKICFWQNNLAIYIWKKQTSLTRKQIDLNIAEEKVSLWKSNSSKLNLIGIPALKGNLLFFFKFGANAR